jgi:hypothetical protein
MVQNNEKIFFYGGFFGHFEAIWAPQNGPKKIHKGLQVSGMYDAMSKLKKKLLTKSIGPLF